MQASLVQLSGGLGAGPRSRAAPRVGCPAPTVARVRTVRARASAAAAEAPQVDPPAVINPLSSAPPFSLADIRNAIPEHCWERNAWKSFSYLVRDVAVVFGLAYAAVAVNQPWAWPLYWVAQGTMFWALFVVGHDCGHQSFSSNKTLNDFVGHLTHSSILVPYHGWRISHRTHHANHGHVENDESWTPLTESRFERLDWFTRFVRFFPPVALLLYPFYLVNGAPGKEGSHYDPQGRLFTPSEGPLVSTTNAFLVGMYAILGLCTWKLGALAMLNLYVLPYWIFVAWLDFVTYLHHHGAEDGERVPWYRGEEWSYLRGGLSTLDHDYGIFNKIHHDIGTHVVHHLFPQIPHYNLCEATEAVKPVLGSYYREPRKSGPIPFHLWDTFVASLKRDHYVPDQGDIVFYEANPAVLSPALSKRA